MKFPGSTALIAALLLSGTVVPLAAQSDFMAGRQGVTYADLADLSDSADLVLRAQVRKLIRVDNSRAPGLEPGTGRFYAKARTKALLTGSQAVSEDVSYLVDLPLDSRGRSPELRKQEVLLFARSVPGNMTEIQLVSSDGQIIYDPSVEAETRTILRELVAPGAPAKVTGVREIIYVPGNLAGEGETQIFLDTTDGSAASITVRHEPGRRPVWGASFSELVADVDNPPARGTLAWYRLACFLPNTPPVRSNISSSAANRNQALADYRMVLGELGVCRRNIN